MVKRLTASNRIKQVVSVTAGATPSVNTDNGEVFTITGLATNITNMSTNLTGTPYHGQPIWFEITGTATRTINWGASFENGAATWPITTSGTSRIDGAGVWNSVTSKWRCMAAG